VLRITNYSLPTVEGAGTGHATEWNIYKFSLRAPTHNQNLCNGVLYNKGLSIHDTIILRKLQSLGKCLNENMSKAACLAVILVYAMEKRLYTRRGKGIFGQKTG